jgi:hypothetical protein
LRLQRAGQHPAVRTTPLIDPVLTPFLEPAQPVLTDPNQLPDAIAAAAAATTPLAPVLLPISTTAAAAALLPGVTARASSTLYATAPPEPALEPSGGFNGASRFEMFMLVLAAPVPPVSNNVGATMVSRAPVLTAATGGRVRFQSVAAGGGRWFSLPTPLGRVAISHGDYVFGGTHYPLASVRGVLTTALIALGALAGIAALLAAGAVAGRFLGLGGRRGRGTREDLYAAAKRKNIPGRSRMSKAELRRALDER